MNTNSDSTMPAAPATEMGCAHVEERTFQRQVMDSLSEWQKALVVPFGMKLFELDTDVPDFDPHRARDAVKAEMRAECAPFEITDDDFLALSDAILKVLKHQDGTGAVQ